MIVEATELPEVLLIRPVVRGDARGTFHESWHRARYAENGMPSGWVQDNVSHSKKGVLRGLHFQNPGGQGKLLSVLSGEIIDCVVDVRRGSPSFGRGLSIALNSSDPRQLFVPPGFAHGFVVLSDHAIVHYKCTEYYRPEVEHVLAWNDPALGLAWPIDDPLLSPKDAAAPRLDQFPEHALPGYVADT